MKRKIWGSILVIILCLAGYWILQYPVLPTGNTVESREALLSEIDGRMQWHISSEQTVENHIASAIYSANGKSGIALFKPAENGTYALLAQVTEDSDEIISFRTTINNSWYDFIWFNGAQTDHAELTYTYNSGESKVLTFQTGNMELLCVPVTPKDCDLKIVYYDAEGNQYE